MEVLISTVNGYKSFLAAKSSLGGGVGLEFSSSYVKAKDSNEQRVNHRMFVSTKGEVDNIIGLLQQVRNSLDV